VGSLLEASLVPEGGGAGGPGEGTAESGGLALGGASPADSGEEAGRLHPGGEVESPTGSLFREAADADLWRRLGETVLRGARAAAEVKLLRAARKRSDPALRSVRWTRNLSRVVAERITEELHRRGLVEYIPPPHREEPAPEPRRVSPVKPEPKLKPDRRAMIFSALTATPGLSTSRLRFLVRGKTETVLTLIKTMEREGHLRAEVTKDRRGGRLWYLVSPADGDGP
jgi:hypothetical protein